MFEITYTFLGKHSLTFFFNTLLSFVFKDCPLKQKHSTIIPLGFANDQKTESETKVSTEHTARNNGITVACLLVCLFLQEGNVNQRLRKQLFSQSRCINDTPKALHIQERTNYSINKYFATTGREK